MVAAARGSRDRAPSDNRPRHPRDDTVLVLGVILLLIGFFFGIPILWTIGFILVAIGLVLWVAGAVGHAVGGRRHYY
ncbi:hypothetical protein VM95_07480 [Streptomyces rubellomurinus]|uniref:Uncharacterized protein n=1 Tax=Streptomyces rubellomurinus (strain ATCC 31215) TaxID=359131 RepID=A0A0F2TJE7_STRR3|nr:hypothetical protein VM95_07480 [Streptomyces rubellomurinus]